MAYGTSGYEYSTLILEVLSGIKEQLGKLDGGPASYYLKKLNVYVVGLFSLSKFKVGDKVQLKNSHTFPDDHGWHCYESLMVEGSIATVKAVDFCARKEAKSSLIKDRGEKDLTEEGYTFTYDLVFDEERGIYSRDKHNFCDWPEDELEKMK